VDREIGIIAISNATMVAWKFPATNGPDRLMMAAPNHINVSRKDES